MKKILLFTALSLFGVISCSAVKLTVNCDKADFKRAKKGLVHYETSTTVIWFKKKKHIKTYKYNNFEVKIIEKGKKPRTKPLKKSYSFDIEKGSDVTIEIYGWGSDRFHPTPKKKLDEKTYTNLQEDKTVNIKTHTQIFAPKKALEIVA